MRERISQLRQAWRVTTDLDPTIRTWVIGAGVLGAVVAFLLGWFLAGLIVGILFGLLFGPLVALSVFGRRAQKAQLRQMEGVPGAAAAILQSMRGRWIVTPVIAVTRKQDLVHRVVGRPGLILVGEGSPQRVRQLLRQERRRYHRALGDEIPIHTVVVGDGEKMVPLGKLQWHLGKLPRELKRGEPPRLERKLVPLDKSNIPMPQGYIPKPGKKFR